MLTRRGEKRARSARLNEKRGIQPTRLLVRTNPWDETPRCILGAAAANFFKEYVCMTSEPRDGGIYNFTSFFQKYKKPVIRQLIHDEMKEAKQRGDLLSYHNLLPGEEYVEAFWTRAAILLKQCPGGQPFVAWKVSVRNHATLWLWDRRRKMIEVFDSAGFDNPYYERRHINVLIGMLFPEKKERPSIRRINRIDIQADKKDQYCQTYIYYYLYQRVMVGEPHHRIVQHLHNLSPAQRLSLIQTFWDFIIHS